MHLVAEENIVLHSLKALCVDDIERRAGVLCPLKSVI